MAQDAGLSRRKQGFDSPRERHISFLIIPTNTYTYMILLDNIKYPLLLRFVSFYTIPTVIVGANVGIKVRFPLFPQLESRMTVEEDWT